MISGWACCIKIQTVCQQFSLIWFEKLAAYKQKQCWEHLLLKANTTLYLRLKVSSQTIHDQVIQLHTSLDWKQQLLQVDSHYSFQYRLPIFNGSYWFNTVRIASECNNWIVTPLNSFCFSIYFLVIWLFFFPHDLLHVNQ